MKRRVTAILSLLLAFTLVSLSPAQTGPSGSKPEARGNPMIVDRAENMREPSVKIFSNTAIPDFLLIDLNLTPEQAAQIMSLRNKYLHDLKPLQEDAFIKRRDLHRTWGEKAAEQERISVLQKEVKALRDRMRNESANYLRDVRKVLTPQQRSVLRHYWTDSDRGHMVPGN